MKKAFDKIKELIDANAEHRSGFKLQELTPYQILNHAKAELKELRAAPDDSEEMADVIATLIHYCLVKEWHEDFIEKAILHKLEIRFKHDKPPKG